MLLTIVDCFRSISHYEWREPVLLTGRAARLRTLCTCGRTLFPAEPGMRANYHKSLPRELMRPYSSRGTRRQSRNQNRPLTRRPSCRQITWPTAARVSVSQGDTDTKIKTTNCCRREPFVHLSWFGRIKTLRVYFDQLICRQHQG